MSGIFISGPSRSSLGHARALLVLGLPLIGGHLAQFLIGATDTMMLGWYGVEDLAAGVLGASVFATLWITGAGFAFAVMPMVAAASEGPDAARQVRRITRMGLWLSGAFAVLVMPFLVDAEGILLALGQGADTAALAADYLAIAGWGLIPALGVMVLKGYLAALERTQVVLWVTLAAAAVNAFVNWLLIFGRWGLPEMGVEGAAWASLAVHLVSLAALVMYARAQFPEHALFQRMWRPDWGALRDVARVGLPISATNLAEVGLFASSAILVGWLGALPLAAHGIALQIATATFMVHLGLSNAATVRAGKAFGRRDAVDLAQGGRVAIALSLAFSVVTIAVFLTIPETLLGLFLSPDEPERAAILALGSVLLIFAAAFQAMDGAQVLVLGLLRGVQDTRVPMVYAAVSYWAVGLPASYLGGFVFGWGAAGVWAGLVVGLACAALTLMLRFWGRSLPAAAARFSAQAAPA
ncbi:MAG: MATE family efflux transporter [Pseudomonadota bacterium]